MSLICSCSMYLALFPLDQQNCHVFVASCKLKQYLQIITTLYFALHTCHIIYHYSLDQLNILIFLVNEREDRKYMKHIWIWIFCTLSFVPIFLFLSKYITHFLQTDLCQIIIVMIISRYCPFFTYFISKMITKLIYLRVSLICSCPMKLALFPMDEQTCHLNVASCKFIWVLM